MAAHRKSRPDHIAAPVVGALLHSGEAVGCVEEPANLMRQRCAVAERDQDAVIVCQQLDGMGVRRGNDSFAERYGVRQCA